MATLSRFAYLQHMGIDVYVSRERVAASRSDEQPTGDAFAAASATGETPGVAVAEAEQQDAVWQQLERQVSACVACALHKSRSRTVFGVGDPNAQWMFVGEGPGFEEDRQGEPFVGRAGKLLDKMIAALVFERSQVYIANAVKCRPPDNRNPRPEELTACKGYLQQQIALVRPRIIIALGGVAANTLLETETAVGKLRGQVHHFGEAAIPLVVTYHPAYLLRSPQQKKAAWQDLQLAQRVMTGEETA